MCTYWKIYLEINNSLSNRCLLSQRILIQERHMLNCPCLRIRYFQKLAIHILFFLDWNWPIHWNFRVEIDEFKEYFYVDLQRYNKPGQWRWDSVRIPQRIMHHPVVSDRRTHHGLSYWACSVCLLSSPLPHTRVSLLPKAQWRLPLLLCMVPTLLKEKKHFVIEVDSIHWYPK